MLHNFVWHERWTWADRRFGGFAGPQTFARLVRFNVATGLISIVGNLVLMDDPCRGAGPAAARRQRHCRRAAERRQLHRVRSMGVHASAFAHGLPPPRDRSAFAHGLRRGRPGHPRPVLSGGCDRRPEPGDVAGVGCLCRPGGSPARSGAALRLASRGVRHGRHQHRCSWRHHQRLARRGVSPGHHARSAAPSPAVSGHTAAAGRCRLRRASSADRPMGSACRFAWFVVRLSRSATTPNTR